MAYVEGSHHVTLSVGSAQEDVDFHIKTLGMRFIKRTVLFDGSLPVYHLYYSNANGDPSSVVTTFPWAKQGRTGKPGTNQAREVLLSVPSTSLDYWHKRLTEHNIDVENTHAFDQRRLAFHHPSGLEYVFVGNDNDDREGHPGNGVPPEHAIHGIHGVGIHATTPERMIDFATDTFYAHNTIAEDGDRATFQVGNQKIGNHIELIGNRTDDQGTWNYGAGTYHHFAWNLDTLKNQDEIKFEIEGAGYTDISELKDRKYFKSVYVRTPAGALFELAVTHDDGGWDCDENPQELGTHFQLPNQFEDRRDEIFSNLEPLDD